MTTDDESSAGGCVGPGPGDFVFLRSGGPSKLGLTGTYLPLTMLYSMDLFDTDYAILYLSLYSI